MQYVYLMIDAKAAIIPVLLQKWPKFFSGFKLAYSSSLFSFCFLFSSMCWWSSILDSGVKSVFSSQNLKPTHLWNHNDISKKTAKWIITKNGEMFGYDILMADLLLKKRTIAN